MDIATIAVSVGTLLVPYIKKAAEEFSGELGKTIFEKTGAIFTKIKNYLIKDNTSEKIVSRFEEDPDRYKLILEDVLREKLANDAGFAKELVDVLNEIKKIGPEVKVVQRMVKGEDVTGVEAKTISANVKVDQTIDEGKNITGIKADKIG